MITLRNVQPEDAVRIREIYAPHVADSAVSFEIAIPDMEVIRERIVQYTSKYPWIVALENNRIVGYAYASSYREREAYRFCVETSVYIDETSTRKGIASLLYDALFSQLKMAGFTQAFAVITQPNERSVAFHKKHGFEAFALYEKVGFKFEKWYDVLWMRKWIV